MNEIWKTSGFEAFRAGRFGNGGQNLYVSRRGVLQRIYQYDLDHDGYFDLVFCTSQNHCESAPAYIFSAPFDVAEPQELPVRGAMTGIAVDLTGDGYDDLVIAAKYDGRDVDLNAVVYYGSEEGYSERRMNYLPAPWATSLAAGDFTGAGRPSLAFVCRGQVRIFYSGELGVEARRWVEPGIAALQVAAGDLDGDGYAELIVRDAEGRTLIYWGGPEGIDPEHFTQLELLVPKAADLEAELRKQSDFERTEEPEPRLVVLRWRGRTCLSVITPEKVHFFACGGDRRFQPVLTLDAPLAQAVAVGDLSGNGREDIFVAARTPDAADKNREYSWFFPMAGGGDYPEKRAISTWRACDCAIADFRGDGTRQLAVCQSHTPTSFTSEALLFAEVGAPPRKLTVEDARRVLALHRPGQPPRLGFVNHYARSLIGHTRVKIFHGGPDGFNSERCTELPGHCAVEALYADLNDDGYGDLVVANCAENSLWLDPGSFIHYNGPDGFRPEKMVALPTRGAHGCVCADLNRNGYLDLIFSSFSEPYLTVYYGGPDGFAPDRSVRIPLVYRGKTYAMPRWIYLVDLNCDGYPDLVIPQIGLDRAFILWGGPDGFSFERAQELAVWRSSCVRAADLTGNGYPDLIIGGHMPSPVGDRMPPGAPHESFVYVYWNGPDGIRESNRTLLEADGVNSMAVGDFNGDGMLDLFVGNYHDGRRRDIDSYIYWNRRGIGFRNADRTPLRTHSVSGALAADFDGDGRVDLAVANHKINGDHLGYSTVWWNTGKDEPFDPACVTDLPTAGPHGISAVEPGNQLTRGDGEYYRSIAYVLKHAAREVEIAVEGEVPPDTAVRLRLRSAPDAAALASAPWSRWLTDGETFRFPERLPSGSAVGYELELAARCGLRSPRITAVTLTFAAGSSGGK